MVAFNFNNVRMTVVKTAKTGVVNKETVFTFQQADNIVSAEYEGGGVVKGYLVGKLTGEELQFRYCQLGSAEDLDGGLSNCIVSTTPDGRLRIIERFQWESRGDAGENIFEEIA